MGKGDHDLGTIAGRLSYALEKRAMTAHGLAQKAGFSHGYVGRIAGGARTSPRPDTLHRLALHLGVRDQWLAFGKGDMDPADERLAALSKLTAFDLAVAFLGASVSSEVIDLVGKWGAKHTNWDLTPREWVAILQDAQKQLLSGVSLRRVQLPEAQEEIPTLRLETEKIA